MKNKQIISEVINDLRAMTVDDRISERYVLSKLRSVNSQFLKRENDTLRLFYYDDIWTTIDCIEMEEVDTVSCLGFTNDKVTSFTRSVKPIPKMYSYKNGPMVKEVLAVDEGNVYQPSSPIDFGKVLKREFIGNLQYYWFRNGHLIIPNGPKAVHMSACFVQQSDALELCACCDTICRDIMEDEFPCPEHLSFIVKEETVKNLFNFYKRNITDNVPDGDNNNKTEKR